jgi:ferredoxin
MEGWRMAHTITDECTACGACMQECPADAISEGEVYIIDPELCTDCGLCAQVCPAGAALPADE